MFIGAIVTAIVAVICFAFVLIHSHVVTVARAVSGTVSDGFTTMLDPSLDDDTKERSVRQAGIQLIGLSWQIAWRIALSLAATFPPIFLADILRIAPQEMSYGILMRVDFIILVSAAALAAGWLLRRRAKPQDASKGHKIYDTSAYGTGDRIMHALAFSGPRVQKSLAQLDDRLCRRDLAKVPDAPPIFITSLARGGTTALLRAMHDLPQIATHRYCDMPFVYAPVLCNRLAGKRTENSTRERFHGDGIKISLQSPEAFDEVFWMLHWPDKYNENHIELWGSEDFQDEAQHFFLQHFRKITLLRHPEILDGSRRDHGPVRYLGKNNANIARLTLLPTLFPKCQILVPLREPSAHAASLHRQHQNFTELHANDAFSERYMRDIGHFEFGSLHRPINFDADILADRSLDDPNYWMLYWISCFEYISQHTDRISLVAQDTLREEPQKIMGTILEKLAVARPHSKRWEENFLRKPDPQMDHLFDSFLLGKARSIYKDLHNFSLGS